MAKLDEMDWIKCMIRWQVNSLVSNDMECHRLHARRVGMNLEDCCNNNGDGGSDNLSNLNRPSVCHLKHFVNDDEWRENAVRYIKLC